MKGHPEGIEAGYYLKPTVFVNVKNDMTIAQEDIFGPVLSVIAMIPRTKPSKLPMTPNTACMQPSSELTFRGSGAWRLSYAPAAS